jgi:protein TonB
MPQGTIREARTAAMLHAADSFAVNDCRNAAEPVSPEAAAERQGIDLVAIGNVDAAPVAGRYGERSSLNVKALTLTILVHVLVIAVLLGVRQHVVQRKEEERLITVDLSPPEPPPLAKTPDEPARKQSVVAAPQPLVQINLPQQVNVPVAKDPQPAPPSVEPAQESNASSGVGAASSSTVQGGDLGARMVAGKPPRYPTESRRKREQGTVVLSLVVGLDGAVEQISVSSSSGSDRLDRAALDAVRRWRWEPIVRSGQPVKVRGTVEIPFVLQG